MCGTMYETSIPNETKMKRNKVTESLRRLGRALYIATFFVLLENKNIYTKLLSPSLNRCVTCTQIMTSTQIFHVDNFDFFVGTIDFRKQKENHKITSVEVKQTREKKQQHNTNNSIYFCVTRLCHSPKIVSCEKTNAKE